MLFIEAEMNKSYFAHWKMIFFFFCCIDNTMCVRSVVLIFLECERKESLPPLFVLLFMPHAAALLPRFL